jgi:hypothetical protein
MESDRGTPGINGKRSRRSRCLDADSTTTAEDMLRRGREYTEWQTHQVLWDLLEMDIGRSSSTLVRSVVPRITEMGEQRQKSKRTAYLVGSDVGFGVSRMLGTLVSETNFRIKVFWDKEQAVRWLREDQEL